MDDVVDVMRGCMWMCAGFRPRRTSIKSSRLKVFELMQDKIV